MYDVGYKRAVLCVYNFNGSMRLTASIFKMVPSNICRWSKSPSLEATPRNRKGKLTDALRESVNNFMLTTTCFSSLEVVQHVKSLWNISISRQHAHRLIRHCGFTYKRTRRRGGGARIRGDISAFIKQYAETPQETIVSFDESGFDQRMKPVYAYSPSGKQAIVCPIPCKDRTRYNLLMAINQRGGSHTEVLGHSTKGMDVAQFIKSMPYPPGSTLLLDNATIHKTRCVTEACQEKGYHELFTPAYSPEFNPIEMVFGAIKNKFYKARYSPQFVVDGLRLTVKTCVDDWVDHQSSTQYFRHVSDLVAQEMATSSAGNQA